MKKLLIPEHVPGKGYIGNCKTCDLADECGCGDCNIAMKKMHEALRLHPPPPGVMASLQKRYGRIL
jgi:hypothetical protein